MKIIILVTFMIGTMLGALGGYNLKKSTKELNLKKIFKNQFLIIGILFYITAALVNIISLRFIDLSILFPLTSLTYIWSIIIGKNLLNEKICNNKKIGLFLIVLGSLILGVYL